MYITYTFIYMKQLNINVTSQFEKDLHSYMEKMGISQKAEAIRRALQDAAAALRGRHRRTDFRSLLGAGLKAPLNPKPRFKNDNDLWE